MTLEAETKANFEKFFLSWTTGATANWNDLHTTDRPIISYRRITAFQALKTELISSNYKPPIAAFFNEAHNDALVSHVSASIGAWMLALQSLRSFIENSLCALYYSDHMIELRNWERGKRKIAFSELLSYFEAHPDLDNCPAAIDGLSYVKDEYKTLSLAVHASAKDFRMTDDVSQVLLWNTSRERLNKWSSREGKCITGIALLLLRLHHTQISGTQKPGLRAALSFLFGTGIRSKLKSEYKITISDP